MEEISMLSQISTAYQELFTIVGWQFCIVAVAIILFCLAEYFMLAP
jgi:hypothetical protein